MGLCLFNTAEVKPLVEHALAATRFRMGYQPVSETQPADGPVAGYPALEFVHDQGVYLMSNGIPRLVAEDGQANVIVYADGCNPNVGDFDSWYGRSRELVGGDDFVEVIPVSAEWLEDCDRYNTLELNVSDTDIECSFSGPKQSVRQTTRG